MNWREKGLKGFIEIPYLQEFIMEKVAESLHHFLLHLLAVRFITVSTEIASRVEAIMDPERLLELGGKAAGCPDLEAFRHVLQRVEMAIQDGLPVQRPNSEGVP